VTAWHVRGLVLPESVERDVFVVDGRIQFEPVEDASTLATDLVLLPGLVDVHAHLSLASPAGNSATPEERVRASARAHLDAGVLAVREPGSVDHASYGLGPDEDLPRVSTAGRFLAPPGRYFPGLAKEVTDLDLPEAALLELAHSGDWVKLIGDSPLPGPGLSRTFGEEAVVEAVRRVHEAGGRVAMHCGLPEVIQTAIEAGVDSLEHATFLRADQLVAMAAAGAVWVPTLSIITALRSMLPPAEAAALADIPEVIAAAADAGVPVLAGTDAGMGPHGMIRHEIGLLTDYGLSREAAIGAASWAARELLRLPGIEPGAPADLVGYRTDPRDDLSALTSPQLLVLDGTVIRS
jgi:imidazolonepropionase-like amidohydrolase